MSDFLCERSALPVRKTVLGSALFLLVTVGGAVATSAASVGAVAGPSGPELTWLRQPAGCGAPATVGDVFTSFSCGDLGRFTFSDDPGLATQPVDSCSPTEGNREAPNAYASMTPLPPVIGGQPQMPCVGGACAASQIPLQSKWVAVVDWDNWHGRSVSWAIQSLSGVQPVLFDLGGGPPSGATSDVHVLRELCKIVDHVSQAGTKPPVAVNLSFGRVDDVDEKGTCGKGVVDPPLSCMVSEALGSLAADSPIFAAAGNHDTLLFPAAHDAVRAVGGFDVPWFRLSDIVMTSWRTPDLAEDLMPSSSICLDDANGDLWIAPPGTSWASAILTAWVAQASPSTAHFEAGRWRPVVTGKNNYMLSSQLGVVAGSASPPFKQLFDRLRGGGAETSCFQSGNFASDTARVTAEHVAPGLDALPLVFLHRSTTGPTPDPDPCMPCTGGWDDEPDDDGGILGAEAVAYLEVDLTASAGVPEDLELVGLRLVVNRGAQLFNLVPKDLSPGELLRRIEDGFFNSLQIEGLDTTAVLVGDEINLVHLFRQREVETAEKRSEEPTVYWSATPVHVNLE